MEHHAPVTPVTNSVSKDEIILEEQGSSEASGKKVIMVSSNKKIFSQYCATITVSFLALSMGIGIGFTTILIPDLYQKNSEIVVTLEELTWIGSMNNILVTVGSVFSGMVAQWLGRKKTIMILTISYIASWTILHYAKNVQVLFLALTLTGLNGGLAESPVQTYIAEISEPNLRGSLSATLSMSLTIGIFLQFLIGSYVHWRTLVLVNLIFPSICFLTMYLVPESPHWLISKDKFTEAKKALSWLRGWTSINDIDEEYKAIVKSYQKPMILLPNSRKQSLKQIIKPYFERKVYVPFALVSFTFFISCFNGTVPIVTFAILLFEKLNSPIHKYTATMIMGLLKVIGSFSLIFLIRYTGKRILILLSMTVAGSSLLIVSIHNFLQNYFEINLDDFSWVPTTMILIAIFSTGLGIKGIPWMMAGEVFPPNVRSVANGLVSSTFNIYSAIANKSLLYMVQNMTLAGTFLFFTSINGLGLIVLYFALPETEGRSLQEIQEHFAGIKKLNDKREMDEDEEKSALKRAFQEYITNFDAA